MSSKPLLFHPEAVEEAEAARKWYAERSLWAAEEFLKELEKTLESVAESPSRWPVFFGRVRRLPFRRFPFLVIYRETPERIEIVAVAHGRRRPGYWKTRLR